MVAKLGIMAVKCNFSDEKNLTDLLKNSLLLSELVFENLINS